MSKRVVSYHISRLQDKRPEVRLDAIKELVLLADLDALDALKLVYQEDPNEEVRRAAQRAGRDIFLKNRSQDSAG